MMELIPRPTVSFFLSADYYHWERDGALSTGALLKTASSVDDVRTQMDAYVGWVSRVQQETDSNINLFHLIL